MHVGIANPRWRGKLSRHSRHMCNPQFYVSGKRPMNRWWPRYLAHTQLTFDLSLTTCSYCTNSENDGRWTVIWYTISNNNEISGKGNYYCGLSSNEGAFRAPVVGGGWWVSTSVRHLGCHHTHHPPQEHEKLPSLSCCWIWERGLEYWARPCKWVLLHCLGTYLNLWNVSHH